MSIGNNSGQAIERALAFLARSQLNDGSFAVMTTLDPAMAADCVPDPSVFPAALIAQWLNRVPGAEKLRDRALDFLSAEQDRHGLWRHWTRANPFYHLPTPDLDDTSCASQAFAAGGRTPPMNRDILLANRSERGLFYTWVTLRPRLVLNLAHWKAALSQLRHPLFLIQFFRRTPSRRSDIDAVVNANVLYYLGITVETQPVVEYLLDLLRLNKELSSDKWYDNAFVIWYFFSRALHQAAPEAGEIIIKRLRAAEPANALETALAVLTLLYWNITPDDELIASLLAQQLPSGAWPLAPFYHGGRRRWGAEEMTTALCVKALTLWKDARR